MCQNAYFRAFFNVSYFVPIFGEGHAHAREAKPAYLQGFWMVLGVCKVWKIGENRRKSWNLSPKYLLFRGFLAQIVDFIPQNACKFHTLPPNVLQNPKIASFAHPRILRNGTSTPKI